LTGIKRLTSQSPTAMSRLNPVAIGTVSYTDQLVNNG
jgi:hypothetical protein